MGSILESMEVGGQADSWPGAQCTVSCSLGPIQLMSNH